MRNYLSKCIAIIAAMVLILIGANIFVSSRNNNIENKMYRVEAKRIVREMEAGNTNPDISQYESITKVSEYNSNEICNNDYVVENVNGTLYRIEYNSAPKLSGIILTFNIVMILLIIITASTFIYIGKNIIKPFHQFTDLPYELSKGNLTVPLKENKNRFFGKFLWGMDLLRGNLEDAKTEELKLLKEKKTLVLSLSHDIKTPLSSIKLYSKALTDGIYDSDDKKQEVYQNISNNAAEIETYVADIIKASNEDFLHLTVNNSEFYLNDLMAKVTDYYKEKLAVKHISFEVGSYDNALMAGDIDRVIEVIQNIIENAIKYGDGARISIDLSEEEECKLIRIENTGEQIKDEEMIHLFDSFYRGSNVGSKPGSGLGLYICRKLMHLMDGEVFAENTDNGVAFTVVVRMA
ncbi:MAG: HAMP domain-containing histidine kinase [Saccharofermentans sp.]|nr:HAMP domain-containing histidine kinase [Saccharofermentans sp.]